MDKKALRDQIRKKLKDIEVLVDGETTSIQAADRAVGELIGLMTRLYADQPVSERGGCMGWNYI